jgi:hypothetical protein
MRIEAHINASGQEMINMGGLAQKLNIGDVLRAMVLEISPDEALLRLSGGGVLKAGIMETVNLKAGQFVELVVVSKEGGTLFLETAHSRNMTQHFDPETLSDLLSSLHIKPDDLNIRLAEEFIKNGIPVTRDKMDEAHRLIKNFTGLDAEKAAFLLSFGHKDAETAKGIASRLLAAENGFELLAKLLDGELKLGQLLGELQEMINSTRSAETGNEDEAGKSGIFSATSGGDGIKSTENHVKTATQTSAWEAGARAETGNEIGESSHGKTSVNTPLKTGDSKEKTVSGNDVENSGKAVVKAAGTERYVTGRTADEITNIINKAETGYKADDLHGKALVDNTGSTPPDNAESTPAGNAGISYERQDSLAEFMEHFFLKIEEDNLEAYPVILPKDSGKAEETRTGAAPETFTAEKVIQSAKEDLTEAPGAIKSSTRRDAQYTPVSAENISGAVAAISGAIKLINEINYIGVPYLQLPLDINGYKTTAELFVMKRHKGGKRIDPKNLVMYISLDTKNMGRVETILDVKGENINIRLRTEKQQINDYFRENINRLHAGFAECGYKLADVRYTVIEKATFPSKLKKLLSGMDEAGREHSRVDLRI